MPATYQEILSRVDLLLGEPHPSRPTEPVRWEVLRTCVQQMYNVTLNTPVSWITQSMILTVDSSSDTFLISANDFGKDILVETYDAGNDTHVPRPVSRVSLQSQPYSFMPQSGEEVTADGTAHTARSMAIYRVSGAVYARVSPRPTETATYKIWYELATPNTDALSNTLPMQGGDSYLTTMCALHLLPHCHWAGNTKEDDMVKKRELQAVLLPSVAQQERQWRIYLSSDRQSGKVYMNGFADAEYETDYN